MHLRTLLVLALLSATATSAGANESSISPPQPLTPKIGFTALDVPGYGRLPYKALFEVHSAAGESLDAFALRIGPLLRAYSDETRYEACGAIGQVPGGRYGVIIATNESHIGCISSNDILPEGMDATGQTIHSHGKNESCVANKTDIALFGKDLGKHGIGYNTGRPMAFMKINGQGINEFSDLDLDGEDGYLAAEGGKVLHHTNGKVRVLSR